MGYRDRAADYDRADERIAAAAVRLLRLSFPSAGAFAAVLAVELGWVRLSRQAVYDWESGRSRVPVSVLLAGCRISGRTVEDVLVAAANFVAPAGAANSTALEEPSGVAV
jgi:hypothetical protein